MRLTNDLIGAKIVSISLRVCYDNELTWAFINAEHRDSVKVFSRVIPWKPYEAFALDCLIAEKERDLTEVKLSNFIVTKCAILEWEEWDETNVKIPGLIGNNPVLRHVGQVGAAPLEANRLQVLCGLLFYSGGSPKRILFYLSNAPSMLRFTLDDSEIERFLLRSSPESTD